MAIVPHKRCQIRYTSRDRWLMETGPLGAMSLCARGLGRGHEVPHLDATAVLENENGHVAHTLVLICVPGVDGAFCALCFKHFKHVDGSYRFAQVMYSFGAPVCSVEIDLSR